MIDRAQTFTLKSVFDYQSLLFISDIFINASQTCPGDPLTLHILDVSFIGHRDRFEKYLKVCKELTPVRLVSPCLVFPCAPCVPVFTCPYLVFPVPVLV